MHLAYIMALGLYVKISDLITHKINKSHFDTFGMIITGFSVENKLGRVQFFQRTFLLANTNIEIVVVMSFLIFKSEDISFEKWKLVLKIYKTEETLLTTKKVDMIEKEKFAAAVFEKNNEAFVVNIAAITKLTITSIYLFYQAQVVLLTSEEAKIPEGYSNFPDTSFPNSTSELIEYISINNHFINLLNNKQAFYKCIQSLKLIKLQILKTCIKTNLASNFIRLSKFLAAVPILIVWRKDDIICFWVDYQELNNLIIKNQYLLLWIDKSLNCLSFGKRFIQLDLTNTYH